MKELKMKENEYKTPEKKSRVFLYITALIVNLVSFSLGITVAWTSPVIPRLTETPNNPLGVCITPDEMSWLASLVSLGAVIGPYPGGYLVDKIGRKATLIVCMVPTVVSYVLLAFSTVIELYYLARFLLGISMGIYFTTQPMFIGEISEIDNRGMLGCLTIAFATAGSLFGFSVGPYIDLKIFNLIAMVFPLAFIVLFFVFVPESPTYLIQKNQYNKAKESLLKFRGGHKLDVDKEFLQIVDATKVKTKGGICEIIKTKSFTKGLIITCGMMVLQQCTAISAVLFYMQTIFQSSGITLESEVSAIIVGVVQVIASTLASFVVERAGRKPLLLISTSGTCLSLISLGYFFHLKRTGQNTEYLSWLPIVALMIYIAAYNFGAGPLPLPVLSEIFPPQVMSTAATLTISVCFIFSFLCSKFYPLLAVAIGTDFSLWLFAVLNFLGIVFVVVYIPETKGKTTQEILNVLAK